MNRLSVTVAGYTISTGSADVGLRTSGAVSRFVTSELPSDLDVSVHVRTPRPPLGSQTFDSGGLWRLFESDQHLTIALESDVFRARPYAVLRLDHSLRTAELEIDPELVHDEKIYPLDYPLDELLLGLLIARRGGVEFHCAGIIDEHGDGHLFIAQSETGKTTTANLWIAEIPSCEVISDDRVVVRQDMGETPLDVRHAMAWGRDACVSAIRSTSNDDASPAISSQ